MSAFKSWLVEQPMATLVGEEACWWVLGLLGQLVGTVALKSLFGPESLGSRMSIGFLY
ncbi:hypothetical protein RchiOBHm_Chr5g0021411 [Rosa chinensis]|uniref:Uncharacterized protein n=1 Tax=Rosa chinensis TaxID=74649 RepID=A0A2P6Q7K7_ROSCH|nr:hypothetical protein RchiOBHm_Chr5g0021411 [Rosa chinensis]